MWAKFACDTKAFSLCEQISESWTNFFRGQQICLNVNGWNSNVEIFVSIFLSVGLDIAIWLSILLSDSNIEMISALLFQTFSHSDSDKFAKILFFQRREVFQTPHWPHWPMLETLWSQWWVISEKRVVVVSKPLLALLSARNSHCQKDTTCPLKETSVWVDTMANSVSIKLW